jgi:hypothetical protein
MDRRRPGLVGGDVGIDLVDLRALAAGLGAAALVACSGDKDDDPELPLQQAAVLDGFRFGWDFFNHRLSRLQVVSGLEGTDVAVIGGTSTTLEPSELPATCEPAGCQEFPFYDTALVSAWWSVVESRKVALVPMTVSLEVDRDGASATATGELPGSIPDGVGVAVLSGLSIDTDHPLAGDPDCYQPRYGWHPNRIAVSLGDPTLDGATVSVPVEATFSAGKTFDPDRQCIDAVNERAVVSMEIQLVVAWGDTSIATAPLAAEAHYPYSGDRLDPGEQVEAAAQAVDLGGIADPMVGFRRMDFRFDPERTDDRGAYLRTFGWWVTPEGEANAVATNFSPGTQLEDFGYAFEGEVVAIDVQGTITRGLSTDALPADLDESGDAVVTTLPH